MHWLLCICQAKAVAVHWLSAPNPLAYSPPGGLSSEPSVGTTWHPLISRKAQRLASGLRDHGMNYLAFNGHWTASWHLVYGPWTAVFSWVSPCLRLDCSPLGQRHGFPLFAASLLQQRLGTGGSSVDY